MDAPKDNKVSPSQTMLTQYDRDQSSNHDSVKKRETSLSKRQIQSPGDVRRALREDMLKKGVKSVSDKASKCDPGQFEPESKTKHHEINLEESDEDNDIMHKLHSMSRWKKRKCSISPPSPPSTNSSPSKKDSTRKSITVNEIIAQHNEILEENIELRQKYTAACKVASCYRHQLETLHYATRAHTAQQIDNMPFVDICELYPEK